MLEDAAPRLRAAAQQLLDSAIAQGLTALLPDDLRHADGASIELLQSLSDTAGCAGLLALRPGEGDASLRGWVQALQQASSTQMLAPAAWPLAPTVQRLIQLRLARLSAATRQVARCVAVLGQDSLATRVAPMLDPPPLALADAWAEREIEQARQMVQAALPKAQHARPGRRSRSSCCGT